MGILRLILGDQLSESLASLRDADPAKDTVMLCEVMEEATYVPHHKKKIAFIFSCMRHFAKQLRDKGFTVRYVALDDVANKHNFSDEVKRALVELKPTRLVVTEPGEYRVFQMMQQWERDLGITVEIRNDTRFLSTQSEFSQWAKDKKQLRMEYFYRDMRKKYNVLMTSCGEPAGGAWNYDKDNRNPPLSSYQPPTRIQHALSPITQEVIALVEQKFTNHFGTLEFFDFAVTREAALAELRHFIENLLQYFGAYQDAMIMGEPYLYHARISSYLNVGLLLPLEACHMAEHACHDNKAPLNAVEGFIRQILGWREYIRGIYWHYMPSYGQLNTLQATKPLPKFYWTAETHMHCVAEAVRHTRDYAYSHHIQRLMVTGNFALLSGLDVHEVQEWYLSVYADAYEWVEMPNTLGMALFGDGGIVASKPYAASGKYINRMSNTCKSCVYDPNLLIGDNACPFNSLYWDFIARHENTLCGNQRMPYVVSTWEKFGMEKQTSIRNQAARVIQKMESEEL